MELFLGNLPYESRERDILAWLAPYGATEVRIMRHKLTHRPMGYAFATVRDGERAIAELHGRAFGRRQKVRVEAAQAEVTR